MNILMLMDSSIKNLVIIACFRYSLISVVEIFALVFLGII